jgi:Protein of unknown function (DUF4232)
MIVDLFSVLSPRPHRRLIALCAVAALSGAAALADVPAAGAAAPGCQTAGLVVWLDTQGNGTAGTIFYTLNFTNLSGHTCTLRGYPGVSAVNVGGHILGSAASRLTGHAVHTVSLANGHTASATLGLVDTGAVASCHQTTAAGFRVFPPNQTASRTIPFPFPACSNTGQAFLRIEPIS